MYEWYIQLTEGFGSKVMNLINNLIQYLSQARFFFQQLISGVSYCHSMVQFKLIFICQKKYFLFFWKIIFSCQGFMKIMIKQSFRLVIISSSSWQEICHRDLKLENTLLDGSIAPRVKICDFGYSKVLLSLFTSFGACKIYQIVMSHLS